MEHVEKKIQIANADIALGYAPGKVILAGEHAVVYGSPAIAMALDRGVRVIVRQIVGNEEGPILRTTGFGAFEKVSLKPNEEGPQVLKKALSKLVELCGDDVKKLEVIIDSSLPAERGLGSSAALSIAILRGVFRFFNQEISKARLLNLAMELEIVFHGQPSGIDHTVIAQGGIIWYKNENGYCEEEPLALTRDLHFAIGITNPHPGTSKAVKAIRKKLEKFNSIYKTCFSAISDIVYELKKNLLAGKLSNAGELMNINQGYLNAIGVSTPEIEALCSIARQQGALGAKLTGAGGGGAVLALVEGNSRQIVESFQAAGYLAFTAYHKAR